MGSKKMQEASDLLVQLASASGPTRLAHRMLQKASAASPHGAGIGTDHAFWPILVARYNLAVTLGTMRLLVARMHEGELLAADLNRQTSHFLEMCVAVAEMWKCVVHVSVRNNAHEVLHILKELTEVLLKFMSNFGDDVEETVAKEIEAVIARLESCRMAA